MSGKLLQKLPNPFIMDNSNTVKTREDWAVRRNQLKKLAVDLGYGGMPPNPDRTAVQLLSGGMGLSTYMITAVSGSRQLSFELKVHIPFRGSGNDVKKFPVILECDGCWNCLKEPVIENLNKRGIVVAQFNRTAIVRDVDNLSDVMDSPLYKLYPGIESSTMAGWAWGFSRCIDALVTLPFVDAENIAITGHSRGGKAVLLAGAVDERAAIVNPNCSGAGGAGCWRYHLEGYAGENGRNENLADLLDRFPNWMGKGMKAYHDDETAIPFDQHYLKALVAPRYFLQTDGLLDVWANPQGSHATFMAAREAYRFLGAEDKILAHYRNGGHDHALEDFSLLADLIGWKLMGVKPDKALMEDPFPGLGGIYDWKCPN